MQKYIKLKSSEDLHKYNDSDLPNLFPCMIGDDGWAILDRSSKSDKPGAYMADAKSGNGQWLHMKPEHYGIVLSLAMDLDADAVAAEEFPDEPMVELISEESSEMTEDFSNSKDDE